MSGEPVSMETGKRSLALDTRLLGRRLLLTRGVWLILALLTLGVFFGSFPAYLAQLRIRCAGVACSVWQLTPEQAATLRGVGISLTDYAVFTLLLILASVVLCLVVSTVIIWRRSSDRMALLVALMLVTLGPLAATFSVSASSSPWLVPNECLSFLFLA